MGDKDGMGGQDRANHHGDGEVAGGGADARAAGVVGRAPNCTEGVRAALSALVDLQSEPVAGDLVTGAALADSVVALARARNVLDAEIARRLVHASAADCLRHTPRTTLIAEGGWAGSSAAAMITAAQFADHHHEVGGLWRAGAISVEAVAALARGLAPLPTGEQEHVVAAVLPHLPNLSVRSIRRFVADAVDIIAPHDTARRDQRRQDQRFLAFSTYCGSLTFHGQLPALEGDAFRTAITALAESLRAQGDGLTAGQRHADALITLVNQAAAHGDLPTTAAGIPVAASVTISLSEAERLLPAHSTGTGSHPDGAHSTHETQPRHGDPATLIESATTLGDAAARFVMCCADLTGVIVTTENHGDIDPTATTTGDGHTRRPLAGSLARVLAATRVQPLALGRTTRLATRAQRTALAIRDRGCVIPGCERPPGECQTHHVTEWAQGGTTDLDSLALLCWAHHRQVDLHRWRLVRNPDPVGPFWIAAPIRRHAWIQRRVA